MKIRYPHFLLLLGGIATSEAMAQCPAITCPSNITVNAAAATCAANVTYTTPVGVNPCGGPVTTTFNFNGAMQSFTVPTGVTSITVDAQGAQGGGTNGGLGGRAQATIPVTAGEVLQVWVGGRPVGQTGPGGFNGGGNKPVEPCGSGATYSFPGGGASDIRRGAGLANRLIVAGGGGGQGWSSGLGGAGGGTSGTDGAASWIAGTHGRGGTPGAGGAPGFYSGNGQSALAGTLGVGGEGRPVDTYCSGAGGGGGYYGGGGGYVSAAGGGSSYTAYPGNTSTASTVGFRAGDGTLSISYTTGGTAITTRTAGPASGGSFPVGTTTVTHQVSDGMGGTASCSFTVTVTDAQAPAISCPANISMGNSVGTCGATVSYTAPVGTDNCSGVTTTRTAGPASGGTFPIGATTVTHQTTDGAGLNSSCSFTVTVTDTESPAITCPANISTGNSVGTCGATVSYTAPVGTDNCSGVSTTRTAGPASGSSFSLGSTTVTHQTTDGAGLNSSCSFTVTVTDTESPAITCTANISVANSVGTCGATVSYTAPVGTDNCPGVTTSRTAGPASGGSFPVGSTTVTHQATDGAGLNSACSFTVTVTDAQAPAITCPANISVANSVGTCGATVSYTAPIGTDNCSGVTTTRTAGPASGGSFPMGSTTVTHQATDGAGLNSACSFTVTVTDTETPAITCPANISTANSVGTCGATVSYTAPVGTDNCSGITTTRTAGLASGSLFPVGPNTVTYTTTDGAGLITSCSFTVTVNDTETPLVTCPANITVPNAVGTCGAVVTYTAPVGQDNCAGAVTSQTAGLASGSTFPAGATTISFGVIDAVGLTGSCSFTIQVNDTELPVISCPAPISVINTVGVCGAVVTYTAPSSSDNCPGVSPVLTSGLASGSIFPVGATTVAYQATDGAGNSASCSFTVSVSDNDLPLISCPASISASATVAGCAAVVTYIAPVATDNCGNATTTLNSGPGSGATFPSGLSTVTFSADDGNGNTATCSFTVTVSGTATSAQTLTICEGGSVTVGTNVHTAAGVYTDTLSTSLGCDSIVTTILSVTPVNTSTSVSGATITAATTGATYQWVDCNNGMTSITGQTGQTFTATQSGSYAVIVGQNGCSDTSGCSAVTVVGIDAAFGQAFTLFPNPGNGDVTINFGQDLYNIEVRVSDMSGKLLFRREGVSGSMAKLDLRHLSQGTYLVELRSQDLRHVMRMVVQ